MILFYYIYNNCKSNRDTVIVVKRVFFVDENHRGKCNCNIYTTNTCGIFCYGITYLMILNDVTARRFNVLYGLIINFPNLPSGRK